MEQMYAMIYPDGQVARCCASENGKPVESMGPIMDPEFQLFDTAMPCTVGYLPLL